MLICRTITFITFLLQTPKAQTSSLEDQQPGGLHQELESDPAVPITQAGTEHRDITNSLKPCLRWNCETRHCSCSCHNTCKVSSRFWALEYTPFTTRGRVCDNEMCGGTKYQVALRFALSQLGIRWLAALQLHVAVGAGSLSLRPSLVMQRIVPYTSPGFEILHRVQYDGMSFEEARNKLVDLCRSDPTFKDHVNPSGYSYIEVRRMSTRIVMICICLCYFRSLFDCGGLVGRKKYTVFSSFLWKS